MQMQFKELTFVKAVWQVYKLIQNGAVINAMNSLKVALAMAF